jgi:hypothetical protein
MVELSPGTRLSFKVNENSPKLGKHERELFHPMTAELLCLTKHLRARMHLRKEAFDDGNVIVKLTGTKDMKADGLSKPFDPGDHIRFAKFIQGDTNK